MNRNKWIFILLLFGLFFRIIISFHDYSGDVPTLISWGQDAAKHGLSGFYERNFEKNYGQISPNYPPLSIFIFTFLYLLKGWIYQVAWFSNLHLPFFPSKLIFFLQDFNYLPYLFKLPAILSDIGIAYVSYLFAKKIFTKNQLTNKLIPILVLLNPAYFYNSAYWGQNDSVPLFFLFTSFYLLLYKKKFILSGIFFVLAILAKQTIFIFTPLYLIVFLYISNIKVFVKSLATTIVIFWLFFLPFYKTGNFILFPFYTFINKILLTSGLLFTSNHAFNIWYLLTGSRRVLASEKFIFNLSYDVWGYLTAGFISVLIIYKLVKTKFPEKNILFAGFLIPFTCFLFLTKMHERHLILALPFLLLLTYHSKFILYAYIFLSLFNFLNMYHNWWSPNIYLLMEVLSSETIIKILTITLFGVYFISLKNYFLIKKK